MKRFLIEVAYDGSNYCGWQIQPNGISIEETLNRVLSSFLSEEIKVIGASRTDAGVHAMGNMAVFDSATTIPPDRLCYALNTKLPEDIRIRSSREVAPDFHPRYSRSRKIYEYHIQNVRLPVPVDRFYSHLVTTPLDLAAMREGAGYLVGRHDFKSFCAAGSSAKTTVRTVNSIEIEAGSYGISDGQVPDEDRKVTIRVSGEGFLYNMVRIMAGTLIWVGLHVYPPEYVETILLARDRQLAAATAPAKGLILKKIIYL